MTATLDDLRAEAARLEAEALDTPLNRLRQEIADAEGAARLEAAERKRADEKRTLDSVLPTMIPLDRENHIGLGSFKVTADIVAWNATNRDQSARAIVPTVGLIDSPRVSGDVRYTVVDGYPMASTSQQVLGEICRILSPVVRQLGNGALADELMGESRSTNRLPPAREVPS